MESEKTCFSYRINGFNYCREQPPRLHLEGKNCTPPILYHQSKRPIEGGIQGLLGEDNQRVKCKRKVPTIVNVNGWHDLINM